MNGLQGSKLIMCDNYLVLDLCHLDIYTLMLISINFLLYDYLFSRFFSLDDFEYNEILQYYLTIHQAAVADHTDAQSPA